MHRDVKPGNLLIEQSSDDDPDHVYLADFGITKHAMSRSGLTSTGQFLGTVDYVAPEQILGMSVLGSADQYSLGCVLYECLTGRVPFEKDLDAAIIWAHVEESPTTPTELRPDLPPAVDNVFARVLAKQPGDRYGSCREFVEATRAALGSLAAEPQAGGIPGSNALDPLPEPPIERVAAGAQAARANESDTTTSHRQAAGAPPGETGDPGGHHPSPGRHRPRRWFLQPGWIAALTALILVAVGAGTWVLVSGGSASHARSTAMPSKSATPKAPTSALMNALIVANQSGEAKGLLPPSTCKQQSTTVVTCTAPAPGITGVVFRTYPSLTAMYAEYTTFVKSLNSGQFNANFQDCGIDETYGEVAWNHMFQHPKTYSVTQMSAGMVTDVQAAGRVFCNFSNSQEYFVWTQDDGHLLAYVACRCMRTCGTGGSASITISASAHPCTCNNRAHGKVAKSR